MANLFSGKAVFVTGAASGLGRATAIAFAAENASVCLVDINADGLQQTEREIRAIGASVISCCADIASKPNCQQAIDAAVNQFGRLDVLCNIAGMLKFAHCTDISADDWNRIIGVNLSAAFFLSQAAIPHLLKTSGNIVNVASSAAFVGEAYLVPYATTKAALVHMTKSMAMEYLKQPLRINAIAPGGMLTGMANQIALPEGIDGELMQRYCGVRAASQPEEIAKLVLYLASDDAKSVHGACFAIDGGISAG
jgi:meso-butanediol dehydrogenase/(S,S)-butanediol dehydrogenase/diacetyl reductase